MLWGNVDNASGNQKPVFANTTNTTARSTINGGTTDYGANAANSLGVYGAVFGISANEAQTNNTLANTSVNRVPHAGWVSQKIGTGYVKEILITSAGDGFTAGGNTLTITDQSNRGSGAVARFGVNNISNTINSVTISSGGQGYVNSNSITVATVGAGSNATFQVILGGRAGRIQYETLVAMGSITGDDPRDNVYFGTI